MSPPLAAHRRYGYLAAGVICRVAGLAWAVSLVLVSDLYCLTSVTAMEHKAAIAID